MPNNIRTSASQYKTLVKPQTKLNVHKDIVNEKHVCSMFLKFFLRPLLDKLWSTKLYC